MQTADGSRVEGAFNRLWQRCFANLFLHRVFFKAACAVLLPACALAAALTTLTAHSDIAGPTRNPSPAAQQEWPREWQGAALRPLALSEVEQRFARRFPGTMARLTDGRQVLVMRRVDSPTRMLHPAADCYQAVGYRITDVKLEQRVQAGPGQPKLWRCFQASRDGSAQKLRVCERIEDAAGQGFTDTSAWYWAAALGRSQGPWQAVTVASVL